MFLCSDYTVNKSDPNAIVCRSATGEDVRLTIADFTSEEEFQKWKDWSDTDYRDSERRDRAYNDRRWSLDAVYILGVCEYNEWLAAELKASEESSRCDFISSIRSLLTATQYSRLWRRFACGYKLADIATEDGVSIAAVSNSIKRAAKRIRATKC